MGKTVEQVELERARTQLHTCREPGCRNFTNDQDDPPCAACLKAHKLVRKYPRAVEAGRRF